MQYKVIDVKTENRMNCFLKTSFVGAVMKRSTFSYDLLKNSQSGVADKNGITRHYVYV